MKSLLFQLPRLLQRLLWPLKALRQRAQKLLRWLLRPLQPLQRLLLAHQPPKSSLPPRERAHTLVWALRDLTLDCLREQRLIYQTNRLRRRDLLVELAQNIVASDWHPTGLTKEDMKAVGPEMIKQIILLTADGRGLGAYESNIYELYTELESLPETKTLPEVQNPWRSGTYSARRSNARRRLP